MQVLNARASFLQTAAHRKAALIRKYKQTIVSYELDKDARVIFLNNMLVNISMEPSQGKLYF